MLFRNNLSQDYLASLKKKKYASNILSKEHTERIEAKDINIKVNFDEATVQVAKVKQNNLIE